jgi:hypothetical protein
MNWGQSFLPRLFQKKKFRIKKENYPRVVRTGDGGGDPISKTVPPLQLFLGPLPAVAARQAVTAGGNGFPR